MKNITLSAEKELIKKAREKALSENTSLNAKFREWLQQYIGSKNSEKRFLNLLDRLVHVKYEGEKMTREERNER